MCGCVLRRVAQLAPLQIVSLGFAVLGVALACLPSVQKIAPPRLNLNLNRETAP